MGLLALSALLCSPLAQPALAQHRSVRVQVIDRGQADGMLIRTPNDQWVVIDAGTNSQQVTAMADTWGVDRVALAIVSHRHFDHFGGMDDIINSIPVDRLVMNMAGGLAAGSPS
jgi:beta-lactamase superfamily II metal-dependent hydrolase